MTAATAVAGSYRDPGGHVYTAQGRIFRSITASARDDYRFLEESGLIRELIERRWLVDTWEVDAATLDLDESGLVAVVEHRRVPFVSHPYEWSFAQLQAAALLQLDLHLHALTKGATLSDASAYNVQFVGANPVFIDLLSLRKYREGEFWLGHRQFCEQYLNPLLLRSWFDIPHNAWFRGTLEGIPTEEMAQLVPWRKRASLRVLSHVVFPARLQRSSHTRTRNELSQLRERTLPLPGYRSMLTQLRSWIDGLAPASGRSVWGDYVKTHTYDSAQQAAKRDFVAAFVRDTKPALLWDIGCNTGDYSELALQSGATYVVGFDFDRNALELAYARARANDLAFLPLFLDATNPSPDQGWRNAERDGLQRRATANALLALAFEHHLAIGRNVPLDQVVEWLVGLAPKGVIEWVEKSDSTAQRMLMLREDIFDRYTRELFEAALGRRARIVTSATVSSEGRRLYWYDCDA